MSDIPNTELLKLFYRTMKGDDDGRLYSMALRGTIYPNFEEFQKFLSSYQKTNKFFSKTVKRYQLIPENVSVFETVLNKEYTVSEFLEKPSKVIESTYGDIRLHDDMIQNHLKISNEIYISNGMYSDTIHLVHKFMGHKPFVVGICENVDSIRYQEDFKVVESLKKEYREKVKIYKGKQDNLSMYVVSYSGASV